MMTSISIGTSRNSEAIRTRLGKEFSILQSEGLDVSLEESHMGDYTFLDCYLDKAYKPEQEMVLRHYIANAISEFIINVWEQLILSKITKEQFYFLTKEEKENVVNKARQILESTSQGTGNFYLYRLNRKSKILHKILDYLTVYPQINIDGFINFRLQDYINDLQEVLQQAVDEFMLEKEYQEFILLLKYFVDIQEPRANKVHVVLLNNGSFQLFDENNKALNHQYLEGCIVEMVDNEINYEDLLISALITIAPREIVMHIPEPIKTKNVVTTIQGVFDDRVVFCPGCHRCMERNHRSH